MYLIEIIMLYLFALRILAQRVKCISKQRMKVENALCLLFYVYEEMTKDGVMNWGRLLIFIAYAENFNLTKKEWNVLLNFIQCKHSSSLPSVSALLCLFLDLKS